MQYIHQKKKAAGNPDREACNVQYAVGFILGYGAKGDLQEVFEHMD
jgi:hypothetical protein